MLDGLRDFGKTIPGKMLGGLLLVAMAGFGVSGVLQTIGDNVVARVGDQEITTRDFARAYQQSLNAAAQQFGSTPTVDQAVALGLPTSTLESLATDATVDALGSRMGLGVSNEKLGKIVRQDPGFADLLGSFDADNFKAALQRSGFTENEYMKLQSRLAERQQIAASLFGDVDVSDTAARILTRYSGDRRTIEYLVLHAATMAAVAEPTESEMQAYLKDNQAKYQTPATRTINLTTLTPETISAGLDISSDDIAAEYERTKDRMVTMETRHIRQVVLSDDATVKSFQDGLDAGKGFDELASELTLSITDFGTLSKSGVTDAGLGDTAFGLTEGGTAIIDGVAGKRAVNVDVITPGGTLSLADAKPQIIDTLKKTRARAAYPDTLDQIEELRAAFKPMAEIAERFGLKVTEVPLTEAGSELSAVADIPADQYSKVVQTVFAAKTEGLTPSLPLTANLTVWFDILSVADARDQTIDEVRDQIKQSMITERTNAALDAHATDLIEALDDGKTMNEVATDNGGFAEVSNPFNRSGLEGTPVSASVASSAFEGGVGYAGSVATQDGERVVFVVTSIAPADGPVDDRAAQYARQNIGNSLLRDFVNGVQQDLGTNVHQSVLLNSIGLSANGQN